MSSLQSDTSAPAGGLNFQPAESAKSNADRIRSIIENLGLTIAAPEEARLRLTLKDRSQTAF